MNYSGNNEGIIKNTIYVEKVKDVESEEESEEVSHLGFRTDNESINESEMSTSLVVQLA